MKLSQAKEVINAAIAIECLVLKLEVEERSM
jgi:hypothetical protein